MFKRKLMIVAAALAVLSVSGCAIRLVEPVAAPGPDVGVLEKLASYAQQSNASLQRLIAIQLNRSGAVPVELQAPEGLDKAISIAWTGPIEPLVKKLAEISGYTYEGVIGAKPANAVNVSISVTNLSVFRVLTDAGVQAGVAADIVIRPGQKQMLIKYPPTTPNGGYVAVQ